MTLAQEIRAAYDRAGESWYDGPARVYRALAQPVVDLAGDVTGLRALDVGTGSGVLADVLVQGGARVVGLDLSHGMLRRAADRRPPGVVADVCALPVRPGSVDLVTAAFVLNHLDAPAVGLRELGRVLRPGGRVLATTFEGDAPHPAKEVIAHVAARHGHVVPQWYAAVKSGTLPLLSTPELFADAARAAGLLDVAVHRVQVVMDLTPGEVVGWRVGMPQLAPFLAALAPDARAALVSEAEAAVAAVTEPVRLDVLLLDAHAP